MMHLSKKALEPDSPEGDEVELLSLPGAISLPSSSF